MSSGGSALLLRMRRKKSDLWQIAVPQETLVSFMNRRKAYQRTYKRRRDTPKTLAVCQKPILARTNSGESEKTKSSMSYDRCISCNATRAKSQELKYFRFPKDEESITGWQVTLSAFLLLVPELFEKKKFVLLSRFNQDALENYFSQVRRMTILLQWTSCTRTRMLLAELMFAMCGNANYEPDDNIILESTQIIPQTDEDCLDLVIDEPSWIAKKHRKIGMIWSSTVPLMWQATFQKNSSENLL
ncbi:hypothetical protein AVEN_112304-1 [Araneus ventricosus]|uniref:Transposable element P transposase n=1 Tax=Araneus ventricosus TaxID=182803 RepID=A0A4Y2HYZ6_ARAVE|nr:hypothetical protein AVEN_112304-1 [Araneus ventricosus]